MKRTYEVRDRADKRAIREFLKREGQFLLPMLDLVEQTEVAIAEVIQVMGRATIEAVLEMSAEGVAGVKQAGRSRAEDDTVWYGRQGGVVYLSDRKVRVERPRLRRRGAGEGGEVEVPAYAAMRRPGAVADRMLEVLMAGVSTRKYGRVIGEMADTVGVSKSAVSRETVEASERVLKELMERRLDAWDLLVIYLDGIQMGSHHVLAAVGVDSDGKKHVLGVREGASENAEVTSALLEDLVERGLDPGRRAAVRDRWLESAQEGDREGVRPTSPHPALPQPQAPQRAGSSAEGSARSGEGGVPGSDEAGREGGRAEARAARPMARTRSPFGRGQPTRRPQRDVHDQPARPTAPAKEMPGLYQPDRQHPLGCETEDPQGDELEERSDGPQMGGGLVRGDREELPPHHRLRPALDAQSPPRRPRTSCPNEEGRLTKSYSRATTFNCQRDTIRR